MSYDDNRVNLIRRIDFAWAVEREDPKKKQKKGDDTAAVSASKDAASAPPWPWQNMVENLQLAHQELSVIIDLINTVSHVVILAFDIYKQISIVVFSYNDFKSDNLGKVSRIIWLLV